MPKLNVSKTIQIFYYRGKKWNQTIVYPTQKLFHHQIMFSAVVTHDGYNPKSDLYILS